jgi:hypothetical protein
MSKKSRRRNRKILGVLGALGAAALIGRRKKGNVERTAAMEDANVGINTRPSLIDAQDAGTDWKKKVVATQPIRKDVLPVIKPRNKIDHGTAYQSSRAAGNYGVVTAPTHVNGVKILGRQNVTNTDPTPYLKKKVITTPPEAVIGFKKNKSVLPSWAKSAAQNWNTNYTQGGRVQLAKRG